MRLHQKEHGTPNNSIVLYQGKLLCISFHLGIHHLLVIPFHQTSGESFSYRTTASSSTAAPSSPGTETIASRVRRKKEQQSSLVVHKSLNKLTNAIVGRQRKSCDVRSWRCRGVCKVFLGIGLVGPLSLWRCHLLWNTNNCISLSGLSVVYKNDIHDS